MTAEVIIDPGAATVHARQQFYAGDDWVIEAICRNPDGSLMDLAGAVLVWRLLGQTSGMGYIVKSSVSDDIEIVPPTSGDNPNGKALISMTAVETAQLEVGYYIDELTVTSAAGLTGTQWQGRIDVLPKVEQLANPVPTLVQRLRSQVITPWAWGHHMPENINVIKEAVDRIETLEIALRKVIEHHRYGDASYRMAEIARRALEAK